MVGVIESNVRYGIRQGDTILKDGEITIIKENIRTTHDFLFHKGVLSSLTSETGLE